jgi:hypothetical protein
MCPEYVWSGDEGNRGEVENDVIQGRFCRKLLSVFRFSADRVSLLQLARYSRRARLVL